MYFSPNLFFRALSSTVLWTVVLSLVIWGGTTAKIGSWVVIAFFGLLAQWEFYCAEELKGFHLYKKSGLFCGALLFLSSLWFLILDPQHAEYSWVAVSAILVSNIVGGLIRLVLTREPRVHPVTCIGLTVFGLVYVPYLFNYTCLVAFLPDPTPSGDSTHFVLLYLLAVTKFSDIGAYLIGRAIGRHQMAPNTSPAKTWEGFGGGCFASLGVSLFLATCLPGQLAGIQLWDALILGILLPIAASIGDLAESIVKRDASIKDSGQSIPGIGGALDLIDSILFTAPVLYFYLYFVTFF